MARLSTERGDRAGAESRFAAIASKAAGDVKVSNAVEWARALAGFGDPQKAVATLKSEGALDAPGPEGDAARLLAADISMRMADASQAEALWKRLFQAGSNTTERAFVVAATGLSE